MTSPFGKNVYFLMKIWIDTNVLLDVLCDRPAFVKESGRIWKLCEIQQLDGYVSTLSFLNIAYILRKELSADNIRQVLQKLMVIFSVVDLKAEDIARAAWLPLRDYEDAVQATCAARIKADYIITRNLKDFAGSQVPVLSPSDFLKMA